MSAAAAVPGIGDAAAAMKLGTQAVKAAKTISTVATTSKAGKVVYGGIAAYGAASAASGIKDAYNDAKEGNWGEAGMDLLPAAMMGMSFGKTLTRARRLKGTTDSRLSRFSSLKRNMHSLKKINRSVRKKFRNLKTSLAKVFRSDPVDVVTGEVAMERQDFVIPGPLPLAWDRHYGSQKSRIGACGRGWESPADIRLEFSDDGMVVFHDGSDAPTYFEKVPEYGPVFEKISGGMLTQENGRYYVQTGDGTVFTFNPLQKPDSIELPVESISDAFGNSWNFRRDTYGDLIAITDNAGRRITVRSQNGRIESLQLSVLNQDTRILARYTYDENGNLLQAYDAMNAPYEFRYKDNLLVQYTNRVGLSFHYEYDRYTPKGRCIHTWGNDGLYDYRFEYLIEERLTRITDSLGHQSSVLYDENEMIIQEWDALGGITHYEYDDAARPVAVIDPDGNRTIYKYDRRGNLLQLTRPDGKSIITEYNSANKPVKITGPDSGNWKNEWDDQGRLVSQTTPMGVKSYYKYDSQGQLTGYTDQLGVVTGFSYDAYGNLANLTDALGQVTKFRYDPMGNLLTKVDPMNGETDYRYDKKGRLYEATLPGKNKIRCDYNGEDDLVSYIDENGAETRLEYCGLHEVKRRLQPDGKSVEYHYDTEERLIAITNQRGERYQLKRDDLGRISGEVDYWGQERQYVYSPGGQLQTSIDPLGRRIQYRTDPLGRILEKILPDPREPEKLQKENFAYDDNGNLLFCENSSIKIERSYDAVGRLVQEQQGNGVVVKYEYDRNGNRLSRTTEVKLGDTTKTQTVNYGYDPLGQATSIGIPGFDPIQLKRNALGQITREQLSSQLKRIFEYSLEGYLTWQMVSTGEGAIFKQEYEYDKAGNLLRKNDSAFGTDSFTYDPLGRIMTYTNPEQQFKRYLNDPAGDRLTTKVLTEGQEWVRDGEYEGVGYKFDKAGNLIERTGLKNNEKTEFVWDGNGRLIESIRNGRKTIYQYDPLGRRISKETDGFVTKFYWDAEALLGDVTEKDKREWVYYPGSFEPLAMMRNEKLYLYHNDPNGCPTRLLEPDGKIVWAAKYDAWGKVEKLAVNEVDNPLRLQGQYFDGETGLYYNRFRYYCPEIGGFISQDPLGLAAGENVYTLAPNVQIWIDPFGLACEKAKTFDQARREAFKKASMTDPSKVEITKYDPATGTAVEFKGEGGAKVGYDGPHDSPGPYHDTQHISWQSAGKRGQGGAERGNIPYSGPRHPSRPGRK